MRQYNAHVLVAAEDALKHEFHCYAGGIEWIVDDRPGNAFDGGDSRLAGVDEHHRTAPVDLRPKRLGARIPKILAHDSW